MIRIFFPLSFYLSHRRVPMEESSASQEASGLFGMIMRRQEENVRPHFKIIISGDKLSCAETIKLFSFTLTVVFLHRGKVNGADVFFKKLRNSQCFFRTSSQSRMKLHCSVLLSVWTDLQQVERKLPSDQVEKMVYHQDLRKSETTLSDLI